MEEFLKIHVWTGTTDKAEEEYLQYFELDYSTEGDFEDPEYKICQFCKDIDKVWYNEDFIGIIPLFEMQTSIEELLKHIPLAAQDVGEVIVKCRECGINSGNAMFYFIDFESEGVVPEPHKKNYNGLRYIGEFNSSLPR